MNRGVEPLYILAHRIRADFRKNIYKRCTRADTITGLRIHETARVARRLPARRESLFENNLEPVEPEPIEAVCSYFDLVSAKWDRKLERFKAFVERWSQAEKVSLYTEAPLQASLSCMTIEKATFGAGCFWGVEAAFAAIPGVTATAVGYEGGELERPSYQDVCTDQTGHAEVVELDFDPERVSFEQLLDAFFKLHDPTTLNRQGPDWGTQYRSAVFFHPPEQEAQARAKIEQLTAEGRFKPKRIVTKVEPAQTFWRAEEYHQRYLEKRGLASCHI